MPNIANPNRTCPECSAPFVATHGRQSFCVAAHRQSFHHRLQARGQAAIPLLQAWRRGKRGRTADAAYALGELARLADRFNREDADAGRRPDLIVTRKRAQGWTAADLA